MEPCRFSSGLPDIPSRSRTSAFGTISSKGVSGSFTADQALEKILADTGLAYHFTSTTNVSVDLKSIATSVEVTASVEALAASAPKFSQDPLDTPQTITAVPHAVMQEQGVTTLRDALRNVAGISLAAGEGGAQATISPSADSPRATISSSTACAISAATTAIRSTRKRSKCCKALFGDLRPRLDRRRRESGEQDAGARPSPLRRSRLRHGYHAPRHARLQRAAAALGHGAAFRLNVMGDEGNVAGRDVAENRRFGFAPSLALGLARQLAGRSATSIKMPTTFRTTASRGCSMAPRRSRTTTITDSRTATIFAPMTISAPRKWSTT